MTDPTPTEAPEPFYDLGDNPNVSNVLERNVRTLIALRAETAAKRSLQDRVSDLITDLSGSPSFIYLHIVWFGVWIALNTGRLGVRPFDPYPYGLLTMVVSLEAIFLSTFVLISQNRLSAQADRRADLDLQIGLLTQHEVARALCMLDAIQDKLGIENDTDLDLHQLQMPNRPEDVLEEIERAEARVHAAKKKARP